MHLAAVERNTGEDFCAPPVCAIADPDAHMNNQIGMVPFVCFVCRHFFAQTEFVMST